MIALSPPLYCEIAFHRTCTLHCNCKVALHCTHDNDSPPQYSSPSTVFGTLHRTAQTFPRVYSCFSYEKGVQPTNQNRDIPSHVREMHPKSPPPATATQRKGRSLNKRLSTIQVKHTCKKSRKPPPPQT